MKRTSAISSIFTWLAAPVALILMVLAAGMAVAEGPEDAIVPEFSKLGKYETPVTYPVRVAHISWNLGTTGARGWVFGWQGDSGDSREVLIKSIEPGSPADGILKPFDIIVGVDGKRFDSDARKSIGRAITEAECKGRLVVLRWRDGKTESVTIPVPKMPAYSKTAPFGCAKSARILDDACKFLAEQMPPEGYNAGVQGPLHALLLLASNKPEYLDEVRRTAYQIGPTDLNLEGRVGMLAWTWGYCNLFLTEYYLKTGDKHVLPAIREYTKYIAAGQGVPGTWGHGMAEAGGRIGGYGAMNQAGLICYISLILAKECGVEVDQQVLWHSTLFFGKFAGVGGIPYGDHEPATMDNTANGKNASAAVAFDLIGRDKIAKWYSHLVAVSYNERENGHSGNFFSYVWGPLGALRAGRAPFSQFMREQQWYYDLLRRPDGSLITQPWPHGREGDLGYGNYVKKGPMWSTGGIGLAYAIPLKSLRILGAPKGTRPTKDIAKIAWQHGFAEIEKELKAGDIYQAKLQLEALRPITPADKLPKIDGLLKRIDTPENEEIFAAAKGYYQAVKGVTRTDDRGFERFGFQPSFERSRKTLAHLAKSTKAGAYSEMAAKALKKCPVLEETGNWSKLELGPCRFRSLGQPVVAEKAQKTSKKAGETDWQTGSLPIGDLPKCKTRWNSQEAEFETSFELDDPSAIKALMVEAWLVKRGQVYLNGEKILDIRCDKSTQGHKNQKIRLKQTSLGLLRKGKNELKTKVAAVEHCAFDMSIWAVASVKSSIKE
ncbi:MAG: DUF6288 domain-containing protein [Kiritimatiellia bacterium]|jgi:hypothetical protein|nr:DUF6288 domain-containing protein [Kiritimatiellia bacterium]